MNSGCHPFRVGSPLFIHSRGCDPFGVRHAVQFPIAAFDPERVTAYCIISTKEVFDPEGVGAGVRVTLDLPPVSMPILTVSHDLNRELSGAAGEPIRVIGCRPMSLIGTCRSLGPRAQIEYEASRPVRVIKPRSFAQPLKSS